MKQNSKEINYLDLSFYSDMGLFHTNIYNPHISKIYQRVDDKTKQIGWGEYDKKKTDIGTQCVI